ncbi:hypothetical protein DMB38_20020 [Streptomyces sp. WAC 06738]|uniref:hypothetical protein n=1 Tax=Streptomyces sp. WAC 06738 TaxID=2203210 RepID=UPI000F720881|nr:hypothetical protein [Streptomyces sp. WAC 06738]AZM47765.1 hypothetical protein DMB38_20020 [Streptomyces sp. WAC 06738]
MKHGYVLIYPPAVTKKILGAGLSIFTVATAFRQALGNTPFSVVHAEQFTATYWIAFGYCTIGVILGLIALVHSLKSSSLKFMGAIGSYLLAFVAVSLMNSPVSVGMQLSNATAIAGISVVAFSAWLRHKREQP